MPLEATALVAQKNPTKLPLYYFWFVTVPGFLCHLNLWPRPSLQNVGCDTVAQKQCEYHLHCLNGALKMELQAQVFPRPLLFCLQQLMKLDATKEANKTPLNTS